VFDIRSKDQFDHFHLPDSIHVDYADCISHTKDIIKKYKLAKKKVLMVCNLGLSSNTVANIFRKENVEAFSLKGGITEWSNLNLPRWKPALCFKNKN
jgi:rhodanese-related sulfurtransferase